MPAPVRSHMIGWERGIACTGAAQVPIRPITTRIAGVAGAGNGPRR